MIELMLDDLGCPSGIFLPVFLPAAVIVLYFDILITCSFADAGKGKTAFLCFVRRILPDHDRVDYEPVALLATQVVAGTNYCFLRRTTVVDSDEQPSYQIVYIWQNPAGDVQALEVQDIEFGLSGPDNF